MANYPRPIKTREELNLRLGIKSSLSQLRPVIASLYIFFKAGKHNSTLVYSREVESNGRTSIKLEEGLRTKIIAEYGDDDFPELVEKSQLFTSQLEAIQVALELFFHLAKVDFVKSGLSERTGYSRYNKKVAFSTNMLLVDLFLSDKSDEDIKQFLHSWLQDESTGSKIERGLQLLLNTFTEETQYKIRNGVGEIVFNQEGVYSEILASNEVTSKDMVEPVGPFRVYKSYISSGLHPFLSERSQTISIRDTANTEILENYADMVNTSLSLVPKRTIVTQEIAIQEEKASTDILILNEPRQQIFYGAPGTGKSHSIKDDANVKEAEKKNRVFRTTFHPDSDYSTFVGCYKPSMKSGDKIYSAEELSIKLKEIKNTGVPYPCHKFAAKYWRSLKDLDPNSIKHILLACGFTEAYGVEVSKGIAIGQEFLNKDEDGEIIYTFTPQAFTNAYVKAWNTTENVYLIIEEINRGNCAQIFGDLFQLLDRGDDDKSEYPIDSDTDLGNYIAKKLENSSRSDFPDGVKDGKKLVLPSNLYIWATMNTSDQSLFPIDSAFKRRWDWVYMPIGYKNTNWTIEIGDKKYEWVKFQRIINDKIYGVDNSEDKQLGDYFVNADRTNEKISADTLLNKVLFYIWNDVCKDDPDQIFQWVNDKKQNESIKFSDFFGVDKDKKLQGFMAYNKVPAIGETDNTDNTENTNIQEETPAENDNEINS